jgi:hypothetical protein
MKQVRYFSRKRSNYVVRWNPYPTINSLMDTNLWHVIVALYYSMSFMYTQVMAVVLIMDIVLYDMQ